MTLDELKARANYIPMTSLAAQIEAAHDAGRYCVIFDRNENCHVYFTYKATMRDFHKETIGVKLGTKTREDALEELRSGLVYSMRLGDNFVINSDNLNPDFKTEWQDDEIFPLDEICNFSEWREGEKYMKIVKEEENKDLLGTPKMFVMQPSFTMCFLYKYQSDARMVEVMNNIPNSSTM